MTIEDKIQYYVEALNCFEDTMEKYKFLSKRMSISSMGCAIFKR